MKRAFSSAEQGGKQEEAFLPADARTAAMLRALPGGSTTARS